MYTDTCVLAEQNAILRLSEEVTLNYFCFGLLHIFSNSLHDIIYYFIINKRCWLPTYVMLQTPRSHNVKCLLTLHDDIGLLHSETPFFNSKWCFYHPRTQ